MVDESSVPHRRYHIDLALTQAQQQIFDGWTRLHAQAPAAYEVDLLEKISGQQGGMSGMDLLLAFYQFETKCLGPESSRHSERYVQIYTLFRNAVIFPLLGSPDQQALQFILLFLQVYFGFSQSIQAHAQVSQIEAQFRQLFAVSETSADKLRNLIRMSAVCLLDQPISQHGKIKAEVLLDLVRLKYDPEAIDLSLIRLLLEVFFPNTRELSQALRARVFEKKAFFDDPDALRKNRFIWIFKVLRQVFPELSFKPFKSEVFKLFRMSLKRDDREMATYFYFPMTFMIQPYLDTQSDFLEFNEKVERPYTAKIQEWFPELETSFPEKTSKRLHLGFVLDRIVGHSPFRVLYALLLGLQSRKDVPFDIYLYDTDYIELGGSFDTNLVKKVQTLNLHYRALTEHLTDGDDGVQYAHLNSCLALRELVQQDEIDVLMMPSSREHFSFLFATRTAPLQVFFSFGNYQYDVPGIDVRIALGWSGQKTRNLEGRPFYLLPSRMLPQELNPELTADQLTEMRQVKASFQGKKVIGTIGRLVKIDNDDFLTMIIQILTQQQNAVFLACGRGEIEPIQERLRKLENGPEIMDRFYFGGHVNPHVYGPVYDVFINTFPFTAGLSLLEVMAKGVPVVSVYQETWAEILGMLPSASMTDTAEDCVEKVIQLLDDPQVFDTLQKECKLKVEEFLNLESGAEGFVELVHNLWEKREKK